MSELSDNIRRSFKEGDDIRDAGLTTPENPFPACLEDANLVFSWVVSHGGEYGFDLGNVFGVGDSAGGHILGLFAAMCTNPEYASGYSFQPPEDFAPKAVALNCGAYKLNQPGFEEILLTIAPDLLPEKGTKEELERVCVPDHVTENFPPTFLMTATGDFLKNQAPLMAEKLSEYNIPFIYRLYGDAEKVLPHVFMSCFLRLECD